MKMAEALRGRVAFIMALLPAGAPVSWAAAILSEDFEAPFVDGAPPGWSKQYVTGTLDWVRNAGDANGNPAHGGTYNAMLYSNLPGARSTHLVTPPINLLGITNARLEFWHKRAQAGETNASLTVHARTSLGGTLMQLASFTPTATWTKATVSLPNPSATYYISFLGSASAGQGGGVCIDDVEVVEWPTVTRITPALGPNTGLAYVTVEGTVFASGAGVSLRRTGQPINHGAGVVVEGPNRIHCVFDLTNAVPGLWDVVVTNPDGRVGTHVAGFWVTGLGVLAVVPNVGANAGRVTVELRGTFIQPGATVMLRRAEQADVFATGVEVTSPTRLTCEFDLGGAAAGTWDVLVTNADGFSQALANGFLVTEAATARVIFVSPNGHDANDGLSWASAKRTLQAGLAAATPGDQVWVAAGVYRPDRNAANPTGTGDRNATFKLINGVAVRGGFAGNENPVVFNLADRDFQANPSVLSGDLAGNDGPNFTNVADNSFHVVTAGGTGPTAVLDGFIIRGGNASPAAADDSGGGLHCVNGSPTLTNCVFLENAASRSGGAHFIFGSPTLVRCAFSNNLSTLYGGGLTYESATPSLIDCLVTDNASDSAGGISGNGDATLIGCTLTGNQAGVFLDGGGMTTTGNAVFIDCAFHGNLSARGGGLTSIGHSALLNCAFTSNTATQLGGGLRSNGNAMLVGCAFSQNQSAQGAAIAGNGISTLVHCSLGGNTASVDGGGISNVTAGDVAILTNSILWGNTPTQISGLAVVSHSCVQGGAAGVGNIDADPLFVGPGNLRLRAGSPCLDAGDNAIL
ncbi:MAG: hypothetical protein HRF43_17580, partial [Phycisphaerae bacterium]